MKLLLPITLCCSLCVAQDGATVEVTPLNSGVKASFRGLAMRGADEAWASGSDATVIRTTDGGKTWKRIEVIPSTTTDKDGKEVKLDFRDVEVLPDGSIVLMSIGNGSASKVLRSTDSGKSWMVVLQNKQAAGFFDGMTFAPDGERGILFGDPIDGFLDMYFTNDGGASWEPVPNTHRPAMRKGEYGFAASGTGAALVGRHIWIATGGSVARVIRLVRGPKFALGKPFGFRSGNESSGIFSLAVQDEKTALVVGGDYLKPGEASNNVAFTKDGGETWTVPKDVKMPHKACVRAVGDGWFVTCGRTGIAVTKDTGATWTEVSTDPYYVLQVDPKTKSGFLAGPDGKVSHFRINP